MLSDLLDSIVAILQQAWAFIAKNLVASVAFTLLAVPLSLLLFWMVSRLLPEASLWLLYDKRPVTAALYYVLLIVLAFVLLFGARALLGLMKTTFLGDGGDDDSGDG
ncbi:MAG: hypothetical protein AAGB22_12105 [Bacteroidota bacterium]